jgi:uncharacterized protein YdeI (YjbR/CyaY-like superfamily)
MKKNDIPMKNHSTEVDAYIAKSAAFSRQILEKIRSLFHRACPEIEETIKWGFPHFEYKGIVGSMAAFKKHACFGFWKGKLVSDPHNLFNGRGHTALNAAKINDISALPPDGILIKYILEAVALNAAGVKAPPPKKKPRKADLEVPDDLMAAMKKNKRALVVFEAFSPSHQREYVEWISEAKQAATRQRRLATAIEWIAQGKPRNWKYMRKK